MKRNFAHKIHEILMVVNIKITVFCGMVLYTLVDSYQNFEGPSASRFSTLKQNHFLSCSVQLSKWY
jgi:hypothetical protein